jgi:tetratricopeptide (TPR) repeat protein
MGDNSPAVDTDILDPLRYPTPVARVLESALNPARTYSQKFPDLLSAVQQALRFTGILMVSEYFTFPSSRIRPDFTRFFSNLRQPTFGTWAALIDHFRNLTQAEIQEMKVSRSVLQNFAEIRRDLTKVIETRNERYGHRNISPSEDECMELFDKIRGNVEKVFRWLGILREGELFCRVTAGDNKTFLCKGLVLQPCKTPGTAAAALETGSYVFLVDNKYVIKLYPMFEGEFRDDSGTDVLLFDGWSPNRSVMYMGEHVRRPKREPYADLEKKFRECKVPFPEVSFDHVELSSLTGYANEKTRQNIARLTHWKYFPEAYVERAGVEEELFRFVENGTEPARLIVSSQGMGKTCLLCRLAEHYLQPAGDDATFESHDTVVFVNLSNENATLWEVTRDHMGLAGGTADSFGDLLRRWAGLNRDEAGGTGRILFVFDALDECKNLDAILQEISETAAEAGDINQGMGRGVIKIILSTRRMDYERARNRLGAEADRNFNVFGRFTPENKENEFLELPAFTEDTGRLVFEKLGDWNTNQRGVKRGVQWSDLPQSLRSVLLRQPLFVWIYFKAFPPEKPVVSWDRCSEQMLWDRFFEHAFSDRTGSNDVDRPVTSLRNWFINVYMYFLVRAQTLIAGEDVLIKIESKAADDAKKGRALGYDPLEALTSRGLLVYEEKEDPATLLTSRSYSFVHAGLAEQSLRLYFKSRPSEFPVLDFSFFDAWRRCAKDFPGLWWALTGLMEEKWRSNDMTVWDRAIEMAAGEPELAKEISRHSVLDLLGDSLVQVMRKHLAEVDPAGITAEDPVCTQWSDFVQRNCKHSGVLMVLGGFAVVEGMRGLPLARYLQKPMLQEILPLVPEPSEEMPFPLSTFQPTISSPIVKQEMPSPIIGSSAMIHLWLAEIYLYEGDKQHALAATTQAFHYVKVLSDRKDVINDYVIDLWLLHGTHLESLKEPERMAKWREEYDRRFVKPLLLGHESDDSEEFAHLRLFSEILTRTGKAKDDEETLRMAISVMESNREDDSNSSSGELSEQILMDRYSDLAVLLSKKEKYQEALLQFKKPLFFHQEKIRVDKDNIQWLQSCAILYSWLSYISGKLDKVDDRIRYSMLALNLRQRCAEIRHTSETLKDMANEHVNLSAALFGIGHPDTAKVVRSLASACDVAEELYALDQQGNMEYRRERYFGIAKTFNLLMRNGRFQDLDFALPYLHKAEDIWSSGIAVTKIPVDRIAGLHAVYESLISIYNAKGDAIRSVNYATKLVDLELSAFQCNPTDGRRDELAFAYRCLSAEQLTSGNLPEASDNILTSLRLIDEGIAGSPEPSKFDKCLIASTITAAEIFEKLGKYSDACKYRLRGYEVLKRIHPEQGLTASICWEIALLYIELEQWQKSLDFILEFSELTKAMQLTAGNRRSYHTTAALIYEKLKQPEQALTHYLQGLEFLEKMIAAEPANPQLVLDHGQILSIIGNMYCKSKDPQAVVFFEKAIKSYNKTCELDQEQEAPRLRLINTQRALARYWHETADYERALATQVLVIEQTEAYLSFKDLESLESITLLDFYFAFQTLSLYYETLDKMDLALQSLNRGQVLLSTLIDRDSKRFTAVFHKDRQFSSDFHEALGDYARAIKRREEAVAILEQGLWEKDLKEDLVNSRTKDLLQDYKKISELCLKLGDNAKAELFREKAATISPPPVNPESRKA